jgi:hypothetical protein
VATTVNHETSIFVAKSFILGVSSSSGRVANARQDTCRTTVCGRCAQCWPCFDKFKKTDSSRLYKQDWAFASNKIGHSPHQYRWNPTSIEYTQRRDFVFFATERRFRHAINQQQAVQELGGIACLARPKRIPRGAQHCHT